MYLQNYLIVFTLILCLSTVNAKSAVITVCESGCDYSSIQAAINAASEGDEIQVSAGTYIGNLEINVANLTLIGATNHSSIIQTQSGFNAGNGYGGITILANGVLIDGFKIEQGVAQAVIHTHNSQEAIIRNNHIEGVNNERPRGIDIGYAVAYSDDVLIENNIFTHLYCGVYVNQGSDLTIDDNLFEDMNLNEGAIVFDGTWGNTDNIIIQNNEVEDAGHLFYFFQSVGSVISSNNTLNNAKLTNFGITNTTQNKYYTTIPLAITDAVNGDGLFVFNGTYPINSTLVINKEISITGETEDGVELDLTNLSPVTSYGVSIVASNVSLNNFTVIPLIHTNAGYTFKVGTATPRPSNISFEHITVDGARRTPFDFNGVDNITLNHLTASNTIAGNGISLSNVHTANVTNFTEEQANAWGAIAIYYSNANQECSNNITIDGASLNILGNVYQQDIAQCTSTNIEVTGWNYKVYNDEFRAEAPYYTFFAPDLNTAESIAFELNEVSTPDNFASVIYNENDVQWEVTEGLSLQAAIDAANDGDKINVHDGTYEENLTLIKSIFIFGPNNNISPNTGSRIAEAILKPQSGSHAILGNANNIVVSVKGITIDMENTNQNDRFVHMTSKTSTNWTFENNIFINAKYCVNGTWWFTGANENFWFNLEDNYFYNNTGATNGISIWGTGTNYIDVRNNVWEDNNLWAMNLNSVHGIIANNIIKNETITGSEWYDNQAGFVIGAPNNDITVTDNTFENIHYLGLNIYDNFEGTMNVTNNIFTEFLGNVIRVRNDSQNADVSGININHNAFVNNGGQGFVIQNFSNITLDATCNWWGSNNPYAVASQISSNVDALPFLITNNLTSPNCTGVGPVNNLTLNINYLKIQDAIDEANPGNIIKADAGDYFENVVIDKSITLLGGLSGVDARGRSGTETNIDADEEIGILIDADENANIIIDGIQIVNSTQGIANPSTGANMVAEKVHIKNIRILNSSINGINLRTSSTATLERCYIENCAESGIVGGGSGGPIAAIIRNNEIVNSKFGIAGYHDGSSINRNNVSLCDEEGVGIGGQFLNSGIDNNKVFEYESGVGIALSAYPGRNNPENTTITGNTIFDNNVGILLDQHSLVDINIHRNDIYGNSTYGLAIVEEITGSILYSPTPHFNATCNWWGNVNGPSQTINPLATDGNAVSDNIIFNPWLDGAIGEGNCVLYADISNPQLIEPCPNESVEFDKTDAELGIIIPGGRTFDEGNYSLTYSPAYLIKQTNPFSPIATLMRVIRTMEYHLLITDLITGASGLTENKAYKVTASQYRVIENPGKVSHRYKFSDAPATINSFALSLGEGYNEITGKYEVGEDTYDIDWEPRSGWIPPIGFNPENIVPEPRTSYFLWIILKTVDSPICEVDRRRINIRIR